MAWSVSTVLIQVPKAAWSCYVWLQVARWQNSSGVLMFHDLTIGPFCPLGKTKNFSIVSGGFNFQTGTARNIVGKLLTPVVCDSGIAHRTWVQSPARNIFCFLGQGTLSTLFNTGWSQRNGFESYFNKQSAFEKISVDKKNIESQVIHVYVGEKVTVLEQVEQYLKTMTSAGVNYSPKTKLSVCYFYRF